MKTNNQNKRKPNQKKNRKNRDLTLVDPNPKPYRVTIRGSLCPDEIRVTLKYNQSTVMNSTLGAPVNQLFRGNSVFDPDLTGTGQQPTGHDEWSAFYNNYRVLGSRIRVRPMLKSASTYTVVGIVVAPIPGTSPVSVLTALDNLKSQKFSKWNQFTLYEKAVDIISKMSTAAVLGKPEVAIESDDTYGATVSANPSVGWIWQISLADLLAPASTDVIVSFEVDYDVVYWGRTTLGQS